jgi:hypothetical protein
VLGPRSHFTWGDPVSGGLIVNLDFDQVRLCWAILLGELRQVGGGPADEAALRKLWSGFKEPVGRGAADEAPQGAEPLGATLKAAPDPEIHKSITTAYDSAEVASEKPPNLREIIEPVQGILSDLGYKASGSQIQKLAGAPQHQARRRLPGKTVASEKRRKSE